MTTWNSGPYQQGYGNPPPYSNQPYPGQPGYPPQPGYPQPGYPNAPPAGGYPGAGYPPGGYPQGPQPGFNVSGGDPYTNNQQEMYGTSGIEEDPEVKGFDFSDKSVRRGFIRKVYSILMVQLSITMGFMAWFLFHTPTRNYVAAHPELSIAALVIFFVAMISLACCGEVRRKFPINFILLFLFTLAQSFMLATVAAQYNVNEVLLAVGITAAVCLGLTLFAFQTKWDFTMMGGFLLVAAIVLLVFGIVTIFVRDRIVIMVYASIGALIFSLYLVYDTQMMMGGKHKYSISPEEYVFGALNLYIDIINIFIFILTIIGLSRN